MNPRAFIGVDIGGTKINIGKIFKGEIIEEVRFPTKSDRPKQEIIDNITDGINQVIDENVAGIGVGVPGLVDTEEGIVYNLTNIPSWKEVHLKEYFESLFNIPTQIANDANCFVLGEKFYGKCKPFSNLVGITLGTGLGTGVIANNKLLTGVLSIAGEIADIPYMSTNYEDYCSSKFFKKLHGTDAKDEFEKATSGDNEAKALFQEFGNHLGNLIRTVVLAYGPDAIIFGGALSKAFDLFYPSIEQNLSGFPHQNVIQRLSILNFSNEKIPLFGAAAIPLNYISMNNPSEIVTHEKK